MLLKSARLVFLGASVLLGSFGSARSAAAESSVEACIRANEGAQRKIQQNSLIDARAELNECLPASCPQAIREDCSKLHAEVDAAIPTLVVEARDAFGRPLKNATFTLDGKPLPASAGAGPFELDPGEHSLRVEAPGLPSETLDFSVERGAKNHPESVQLVKKDKGPLLRGIGLASAGMGAAALGFGVYYGIKAKLTYDDALEHCTDPPARCDAQGVSGGGDAHRQARIATTSLVVGGLLLAGGAYLYFTNPQAKVAVGSSISPRALSLDVRARW